MNNKKEEKLQNILCPQCNNLAYGSIMSNHLSIDKCIYNHKISYLPIDLFINLNNNKIFDIKCNKCKNKLNYYRKFFICNCNIYICSLCEQNHLSLNKGHRIIEYNNRYVVCKNHNLEFISYCNNCYCNLCYLCEKEHNNHQIIFFKEKKPNENKIKEIVNEINNTINLIDKSLIELEKYKKHFYRYINDFKFKLNQFNKICQFIINLSFNLKNYENIINFMGVKPKKLYKDINNLILDIQNKFKNLEFIKIRNELTLVYDIKKNNSDVKIFGKEFVINNKKNGYMLINNKKYEISEFFNLKEFNKDNNKLVIKLIEIKKFTDLNHMFSLCKSLISIYNCSNLVTKQVTNLSFLFEGCKSLSFLDDLSQWDTSNVIDMSNLFCDCELLESLPDISSWETNKVLSINNMFKGCKSLKYLPDISNFETHNILYMSNLFCECELLESLPDISKWMTNKVLFMNSMFKGCKSLKYLPDISNWDTSNVINMNSMFSYCISLKTLPNILKWNINNVGNKDNILYKCNSLKSFNFETIFNRINILSGFVLLDTLKLNKEKNKINSQIIKNPNDNIDKVREDLYKFLLSNKNNNNLIKIPNLLNLKIPVLKVNTEFKNNEKTSSNCIFITNKTFIILTRFIYNEKEEFIINLNFPDLNRKYEFNADNFIIENEDIDYNISIITFVNEELDLNIFFNIEPNLDTKSEKKYIINNINDSDDKINYNPGTPIIVKKEDKNYLVGIINDKSNYYIFSNEDLLNIIKNINSINKNYPICHIQKLNFNIKKINDYEMNIIFQFNYIHLIYLNLENNNISDEGLKGLLNKTLKNLEYLNLSNNPISDQGLNYLKYLYNLKELILLNMELSNNYFSILEKYSFSDTIKTIECDKDQLVVSKISEKFRYFKLPNLRKISLLKYDKEYLNILFSLDIICFSLNELDLSSIEFDELGFVLLKNNIT